MASKMPEGFDWKSITPEDSPRGLPDIMADPSHQRLAAADVTEGGPAFDFELPVYDFRDGTKKETGTSFHLADVAANRPVALIFGSYT